RPIRWRSSDQRQRREIPFLLLPERFTMLGHNRKMSGAECLADMLKGYGVTHVFHVPAVVRQTTAVLERPTDLKPPYLHGRKAAPTSSACTSMAKRPQPIWRTGTRAHRASPASARRR